jgi:hypothetical protein
VALLPDLVGRIRIDMSELGRAQSEATSRGAAIGSALGTAVGSMAGGLLAAAGDKILTFVSGSIDAFARLEDATGAMNVKFGSSSDTIKRFADTSATSFGISKAAAIEAANTFGTFGSAAGLAGEPLAQFSTKMVALAGDMASFTGTKPEEAIQAIGAAFRGEFDPIERYGVLLSAAKVEQEAQRLGLVKAGETMTDHARIMATQSLIYQQTGQAAGDFARTSDSVGNTQKRIAAETENAQAALGEKLAPAYLAVLNALNPLVGVLTTFVGMITDVVRFCWEWRDAIIAIGAVLVVLNAQTIAFNAAMAAALIMNSVVAVVRGLTTAFWAMNAAMIANPIGAVVAVIAALAAGLIIAYNHSETFRNAVDTLFAKLKEFIDWAGPGFEQWAAKVATSFGQAVTDLNNFGNAVNSWATKMKTSFAQAYQDVEGFGAHVNKSLSDTGNDMSRFGDKVNELPGKVAAGLSRFAQILFDNIVTGWNRTRDGAVKIIGNIVGDVNTLPQRIIGALQALPGQMVQMGTDIMNGLLRGLQQLGPQIVSYLTNLIPEPVRKALNISSPSGVMKDIGIDVMRGLDQGLSSWIPKIQSTLNDVMTMIKSTGEAAGSLNIAGQNIGYNVSRTAQGISGSATVAGQQVSGSYNQQTGQASVSGFGHTYNIDARSFGTQFSPKDVVDKIIWQARVGGLVPT